MPKIFEYLGIVIFFYSHEHEPIHVHARYEDRESKAEFILEEGKVVKVIVKVVGNRKSLKSAELKKFDEFLKVYSEKIVEKWIDFFVLKKSVRFERISKKIK
jgi:hypothetical protein